LIAVGRPALAEPSTSDKLQAILAKTEPAPGDLDEVRKLAPGSLVELAKIYERSNDDVKRRVAHLFYQLGLKSNDAKRVLMRDVHTSQAALRLEVQWALGRVSDDDDVVDALVDNMRNDSNPLFRDKAACGLANDQIHLNPRQKSRLLRKVIESLASDTAPSACHQSTSPPDSNRAARRQGLRPEWAGRGAQGSRGALVEVDGRIRSEPGGFASHCCSGYS
jgi:hypothetical protein